MCHARGQGCGSWSKCLPSGVGPRSRVSSHLSQLCWFARQEWSCALLLSSCAAWRAWRDRGWSRSFFATTWPYSCYRPATQTERPHSERTHFPHPWCCYGPSCACWESWQCCDADRSCFEAGHGFPSKRHSLAALRQYAPTGLYWPLSRCVALFERTGTLLPPSMLDSSSHWLPVVGVDWQSLSLLLAHYQRHPQSQNSSDRSTCRQGRGKGEPQPWYRS